MEGGTGSMGIDPDSLKAEDLSIFGQT